MSHPPDKLPTGFRRAWEAVKDADEKAPSRRALARRLGVSSFTLHRLLVTGEVPDLARASVRERRAWTRTLARVAHRLGLPPRGFLEEAGIVWDPSVGALVSAEIAGREGRPAPMSDPPWWRTSGTARPVRIGIGLVPGPSTSLPELGDSFLTVFAKRMLHSVAPGIRFQPHLDTPGRVASLLRDGDLDLAVGIWDTADARSSGLGLIPIPGLTVPLRGFVTHRGSETWQAIASSPERNFLVEEGSAAGDFLRTHCERAPSRIVEISNLARTTQETLTVTKARNAVLVLDVWSAWNLLRNAGPEAELEELVGLAEEGPLVRLAIGLPEESSGFAAALEKAMTDELFLANPYRTAELYRALLSLPASDLGNDRHPELVRLARGTRLSPVPLADRRFLERIAERLGEHAAETLLPEEFAARPARDREGRDIPAMPPPHQCQSCSVSLAEFGGPSDHYCRYCSDEDGQLRSLAEVQAGIRQWMLSWQAGATEEDVDQRVTHFMRAMPAWADRV